MRNKIPFFLISVLLFLFLMVIGCSTVTPVVPDEQQEINAFFAGVSPVPTGTVGTYKFTGNDGSVETGTLVAKDGKIFLQSDRGLSVYPNRWCTINIEYVNPRYYSPAGLPVYYIGDTFTYKVNLDCKWDLPLDLWPILYAKVTTEQCYWPTLIPLPGVYRKVWGPCLIPPYGDIQLVDTFTIVSYTSPGNSATVCLVVIKVLRGTFQLRVAYGVCGLWDP